MHFGLIELQAGHLLIALALHEGLRVAEHSRLFSRKALADAERVGAFKAIHGQMKTVLAKMRRHNVPHGCNVVGLGNRFVQTFKGDFDAVAEEHRKDASVEGIG